ncbi:MAG: hypothetical protein HKN44_09695 [Ilumatobacter sp.]|nr:hypothetical protein [Ilumatobacter sp.]
MPWCEPCAKYWTPNSTNDDGTCPRCGEQLYAPDDGSEYIDDEQAPWHFKLMVVALIVYLVWRFIAIFT